jgi:ssDNA-specific exonuclease RecJ
MHEYGIIQKQE